MINTLIENSGSDSENTYSDRDHVSKDRGIDSKISFSRVRKWREINMCQLLPTSSTKFSFTEIPIALIPPDPNDVMEYADHFSDNQSVKS